MESAQPEGNLFNKYENNGILINAIMKGFFNNLDNLLGLIQYNTVYEAGCGEGYISQHVYDYNDSMQNEMKISASDISENVIAKAKLEFPLIQFSINSIYNVEEKNDSFDLVIASEVLEHLEEPQKALEEIFRISKKYVLVSVPNEPIWRIANFARGKYIRNMGNTPGHINHWTKKEILELLDTCGEIIEVRNPFPWTMALCEKRL